MKKVIIKMKVWDRINKEWLGGGCLNVPYQYAEKCFVFKSNDNRYDVYLIEK